MTRKRERHRRHANPLSFPVNLAVPNWLQVFGRDAPFALDIGFGQGNFLLELGRAHPEWNVIGLEIRQHLVDAANRDAAAQGLANVHALVANANLHLGALLPAQCVAFAAVNFPDPWFKRRHHKRRVVTKELLAILSDKMLADGEIHAMSDFQPIAMEILATLEASPFFRNANGQAQLAEDSTTGILTEREIKHTQRGDPIYRMRFMHHRAL